jgi:uncharacterized protein
MKKLCFLLILIINLCFNGVSQTTVFSDDFSSNTNVAFTTSGVIGSSAWSVLVQNADWGARRNTSPEHLELTNDASATANANGWVLASTSMSSFLSPYNTTLNLNTGTITWNFNIRQIRTDPAGLASGSYGSAFILAGTSTTTRTIGTGYAITYGQSGGTDPIRLVEYTAGLGTSSNIITSNTVGLTDFGAEYLSVRVIYTPSTNTWELLLRNDGTTAFADPATGTLVSQGTAINSNSTGTALSLMGAFWNGSTGANQTAFFDNTSVVVGAASGPNISIASGSNATEGGANGTFIINFSPATSSPVTVDYTLPVAGNATFTTDYGATLISAPTTGVTPATLSATSGTISVPSGVASVTVTIIPDDDILSEGSETVVMTLSNPLTPYTLGNASSTITIIDNEASGIGSIQGSGTTATAGTFTVEAIVTGIYPTLSPAGFYIQEEDADADADPNTSEGIFVVSTTSVAVGDRVRVVGTVQENASTPSFNQAVFATATVTILSNSNPMPSVVDITLPVTTITDYEKYEGMLVRFPGTLTVTNNEDLGSFGELSLSAGGLVYQPTQLIDPNDNPASGTSSTGTSNVPAVNALIASNTLRTILLDDGRGTIPTLPYVNADNTVRVGSTITNISGILGFAFSQYRIQPIASAVPSFTHAVRPTVPSVGAGNLKIASFNVLNYFNGDGAGAGFPTSRGASSLAEFNRQRDKIINAISQINADVVGLIEIENLDLNDATSALQDLVNGLNTAMGAGTYSFIDDDLDNNGAQDFNTDQIRCAIIYKSTVVTPVGAAMLNDNGTTNRPNLAQTFNLIATNKNFNFVVNHFKSKGGTGTGADADQGDGQAAFNATRKVQATSLLTFFNTPTTGLIAVSGTDRIISVGDYNAYYEEDPMDILRAGGYTVTSSANSYSYLFGGQVGSLDHAVVSPSLAATVTGVAKWNTNGIEPSYLDYKDGINSGGGDAINPWASTYTVSPWRASDHDAIIMGLILDATLPVTLTQFTASKENVRTKISWTTLQEINSKEFSVERSNDGGVNWQTIATVSAAGNSSTSTTYSIFDQNPAKGTNLYRLRSVDIDNKFEYSATRRVNFDSNYTFSIYPNPSQNKLQISFDNSTGTDLKIQVLNVNGQVLLNTQKEAAGQLFELNITTLKPGMYFLKIITTDGSINVQKFIKE